MGGGLWPRGGKKRKTRLDMIKNREANETRIDIVHGSVEPAKRHQLASLTSRRNPERVRDGPRPGNRLGIGCGCVQSCPSDHICYFCSVRCTRLCDLFRFVFFLRYVTVSVGGGGALPDFHFLFSSSLFS